MSMLFHTRFILLKKLTFNKMIDLLVEYQRTDYSLDVRNKALREGKELMDEAISIHQKYCSSIEQNQKIANLLFSAGKAFFHYKLPVESRSFFALSLPIEKDIVLQKNKQASHELAKLAADYSDFYNGDVSDSYGKEIEQIFIKAIELYKNESNQKDLNVCQLMGQLGYFYFLTRKPNDAEKIWLEVMQIAKDNEKLSNWEQKHFLHSPLSSIGDAFIRSGIPEKAMPYYLRHYQFLTENNGSLESMRQICGSLSLCYERLGNKQEAKQFKDLQIQYAKLKLKS